MPVDLVEVDVAVVLLYGLHCVLSLHKLKVYIVAVVDLLTGACPDMSASTTTRGTIGRE